MQLIVGFMSLSLLSCIHFPQKKQKSIVIPEIPKVKIDLKKQSEVLNNVQTETVEKIEEIKKETINIKEKTDEGEKVSPDLTQWGKIKQSADIIDLKADDIQIKTNELKLVQSKLFENMAKIEELKKYSKTVGSSVKKFKKANIELQETINEYKEGVKKRNQAIWMSVVAFSAVGLVAGIFLAIYVTPKLGVSIILSSIILSSIAYFMAQYASYIAILGGILVSLIM